MGGRGRKNGQRAGGGRARRNRNARPHKNGDGGGVSPLPSARTRDLESAWRWRACTHLCEPRGEAWRTCSPASHAAMTAAGRTMAGSAAVAQQQQVMMRQRQASACRARGGIAAVVGVDGAGVRDPWEQHVPAVTRLSWFLPTSIKT